MAGRDIMPSCGGNKAFLLLYGSQTGQAKAIAEDLHENSETHGLQSSIFCLSESEKKFSLEKERHVVFVCSTTGDGDPPDTVAKFWRKLKRKTLPSSHLSHLRYALLGLGDTNYANFCNMGKLLHKRLGQLGATPFYEPGFADDGTGLEVVVEPWIEGLWPALQHELKTVNGILGSNASASASAADGAGTVKPSSKFGDAPAASLDERLTSTAMNLEGLTLGSGVHGVASSLSKRDDSTLCQDGAEPTQRAGTTQGDGRVHLSGLSQDIAHDLPFVTGLSQPSGALAGRELTIPPLPVAFLQMEWLAEERDLPVTYLSAPLSNSPITMATIKSSRKLTNETAVKMSIEITMDLSLTGVAYEPGDALAIFCPNEPAEVEWLIKRLGLAHKHTEAFKLSVLPNTMKKAAEVPVFLPHVTTVEHCVRHYVNLRAVPKKPLLRILAEYTTQADEKRRLLELCSREGATEYQKYIREGMVGLTDVLAVFPSCNPPLERLFEQTPRLLPRPYSAASSPLVDKDQVVFAFNLVSLPHSVGGADARRNGLCTHWLYEMSEHQQPCSVPIYQRLNQKFHLPTNPNTPIIMVGPGTGVAPFVGFLQHRYWQHEKYNAALGTAWLFFGCRDRNKDFLYKSELDKFTSSGTLSRLCLAVSREPGWQGARYVQDNILKFGSEVASLLLESGAVFYVCGDAKNMSKDVQAAVITAVATYKGWDESTAKSAVDEIRQEGRYLQDVWT